jgi:hypothetical protein
MDDANQVPVTKPDWLQARIWSKPEGVRHHPITFGEQPLNKKREKKFIPFGQGG